MTQGKLHYDFIFPIIKMRRLECKEKKLEIEKIEMEIEILTSHNLNSTNRYMEYDRSTRLARDDVSTNKTYIHEKKNIYIYIHVAVNSP